MPNLTIELARPEDRHEVMSFMREIYPSEALQHDEARWDWMYGVDGHADLLLARAGSAIAGHLALMRCPLIVDGQECELTWTYNLVTAPDHRRQGIMTQMIGWAQDEFAPLAVAGANQYSVPLFSKLGWRHHRAPRRYSRVVAAVPWLMSKVRKRGQSSHRVHKIAIELPEAEGESAAHDGDVEVYALPRFGQDADDLRKEVARDVTVVGRTSDCLNWRFVDRPNSTYRILGARRSGSLSGWAVVGAIKDAASRKGYIVDLLFAPHDEITARALISAASEVLRNAGASTIHCTASWSTVVDVLVKMGFRAREADYEVLTSPALSGLSIDRWHLTRGDANMDDYLFGGFTRSSKRAAPSFDTN